MQKLPLFWAAVPKGRCPVGHRGELPDICPSVHPSPPHSRQGLKSALSGPVFALQALQLALPGLN